MQQYIYSITNFSIITFLLAFFDPNAWCKGGGKIKAGKTKKQLKQARNNGFFERLARSSDNFTNICNWFRGEGGSNQFSFYS
jgi:hypothetical protein